MEESTSKKKKKKKKKKPPANMPLMAGLIGGGVIALVLIVWVVIKIAGGSPVKPITEWDKYSTEEFEFGFQVPTEWTTKSYGIKGRREVEAKGSGATVTIKENLAGSLIGDIAGAGMQGRPVPDEFLPVSRVHEMRAPKDESGYQEGQAVTVMTRFGKARQSEYTQGSKRGYRVTVLMSQTALDVYCECRAGDWEVLRPAFDRIIATLGGGVPPD